MLTEGIQEVPESQLGAMLPLSYVVRSAQNRANDYSEKNYKRWLQIVIEGLRDFRLYDQPSIQVGYFKLSEAGVIQLPPDYLDYIKIGIPINGQLVFLGVDNSMLLNRAKACAEDIRTMKNTNANLLPFTDGYFLTPHYRGGQFIGGLYGLGGGFSTAYFRVDKDAGRIQFDGVIPGIADDKLVVMEYKSTGISAQTLISPEVVQPLIAYLNFYRTIDDPNVNMNQKQLYERELTIAVRKMRSYQNRFTLQEYMQVLYQNKKQSPKP